MKLKLEAKDATEKRVLEYLQANASEALAEKINAGSKTLKGALGYAKDEARKLAQGDGFVCVEDETVFGWIVHYFEESEITEKASKEKPAVVLPSGVKMSKPEPKKAAKPQMVEAKDQKSLFADLLS